MVIPRGERHPSSFERISNRGSPRDLTLLVCPKAYKHYFMDLVQQLKLDGKVSVETVNSNNELCLQVKETIEISQNANPHYRLFALLDGYNDYNQELDQNSQIIKAQKLVIEHNHENRKVFRLLVSNPSFYLWLLLHYKSLDFSAIPEDEWQDKVEKELSHSIANFKDANRQKELFALSYPHIETAIKNSQQLQLIRAKKTTPSSDIHELMAYLHKLQRRYVR
ncbi:MAG: RloB domain-containing protein [Magnetococcales bacterium]|nr:RloB domain-containing protein [Magnetococcales bacterium]